MNPFNLVASGKNNTAHNANPTISPRDTPLLMSYGISFLQNNFNCPNMFPATVPVKICNPSPMNWTEAGSLKPSDNPSLKPSDNPVTVYNGRKILNQLFISLLNHGFYTFPTFPERSILLFFVLVASVLALRY